MTPDFLKKHLQFDFDAVVDKTIQHIISHPDLLALVVKYNGTVSGMEEPAFDAVALIKSAHMKNLISGYCLISAINEEFPGLEITAVEAKYGKFSTNDFERRLDGILKVNQVGEVLLGKDEVVRRPVNPVYSEAIKELAKLIPALLKNTQQREVN